MSNIPKLLFVDEQKLNESLTDYVNRIALNNGFENAEAMVDVFLNSTRFKEKFFCLQKEIKTESIPSYGLINADENDLKMKRFKFKKRGFNWHDLKLFIELVTRKKVRLNSFPRKNYSISKFKLSGKLSSLEGKVCLKCWLNAPYIRFYWNFEDYNFCHNHKSLMVDFDIEKGKVLDKQPSRTKSVFFDNLFEWLEKNRGSELSFNFIEKEIFQFQQDLLLAEFLEEFFELVFSLSLNYDAVEDLLRSCQLVNKTPDERIKIIVSNLCSGDIKKEDKLWCLIVILYFIDSEDYFHDYHYCYSAQLFSFASSVNLSYYRDYVWKIIFKSRLFLGLVNFIRENHRHLFNVDTFEFEDSLNIDDLNKLRWLNLDQENVDFLFSLQCFKHFSRSEISMNNDRLLDKSPKREIRTDYYWFKPLREEKLLLERVFTKAMERMIANIFIKMSRVTIYLPEKLFMRNH